MFYKLSVRTCLSDGKPASFALPRLILLALCACFASRSQCPPPCWLLQSERLFPRPPLSRCHSLDELSRVFSTSSSFLLFLQRGVSGETRILDLSLWIVGTVGVLGERLGHVGASKPPGLQQCPALPWVLEWPNGGLFACWHAARWSHSRAVTWMIDEHKPSSLSSTRCINQDFLFAWLPFWTLVELVGDHEHRTSLHASHCNKSFTVLKH